MSRKHKSKKFWIIYTVVCAVLAVALCVFFAVFNDIMESYEAAQPQSVADSYLPTLTYESLTEMAREAVDSMNLKYEDADKYINAFTNVYDSKTAICRKALSLTTAEVPVFSVICGEAEIVRLTLKNSDSGKYGFDSWEIAKAEIPLDGILKNAKEYVIYAPTGKSFTVNGFTPKMSESGIPSPLSNELEEAVLPLCDVYELGTMYSRPEVVFTEGDSGISVVENEDQIIYLPEGVTVQDYTVCAPTGAMVYVNGIHLSENYVKSAYVPYPYSPIEKDFDYLPTYTVYKTGNLLTSPTITCDFNGEALTASVNGSECTFPLPDSFNYTVTVMAPVSSEIKIDGVPAEDLCEKKNQSAFEGLNIEGVTPPMVDVYEITGLYFPTHQVTGSLNGSELEFVSIGNGNNIVLSADNSVIADDAVSEFAMSFVKAYFHYTSSGYRNVNENLAATLAYIDSSTEFYMRIRDSKIGYEFQTPVSREDYRMLEVYQLYKLDDGSHVAKIRFDVDQTTANVLRTYKGELSLHISGSADSYKILDMVIASES